ncbi:MAG: class I mannose-6-phosphate isomerase, partial [Candidatus Eremiobacteraeota bacterium]|nr:class I mannose-6-phosphate isomerase [Candidatus Eremiobacteraeota bacterium]
LIDTYHSPGLDVFLGQVQKKWPGAPRWFDTRVALKSKDRMESDFADYLTDDPVFGRVCDKEIDLFFDEDKWLQLCREVRAQEGQVVVVGPGALASPLRSYADCAVLTHVPRETVFLSELPNIGDDAPRSGWARYKRNFYVDWPVQNRHHFELLPSCDFLVDVNNPEQPSWVAVPDLLRAFRVASHRPFRIRSLFMPGVWGGTRLQELIPDLPEDWPNCAWGFEVVAPENTVSFKFLDTTISVAFDMLMHTEPRNVLGSKQYRRYGTFFPIRFDFLDTINGTNLSCQVHPDDAYINAHFREPFAQTETYYIMEAEPEAKVYLGLTEDTDREKFLADVARAESEAVPFEIEDHVNAWPAAPGDLFLIPPGTVHCSGSGNLVLEISATPYIYTFKIYDYLRLDLNGEPRPISYARAFEVINFERTAPMVEKELIATPREMSRGEGWARYLLADHPLLFHKIERLELSGEYLDDTGPDGVHVLCIVEGPGATVVRSEDGREQRMAYAETVIVPAGCGHYRLLPWGPSKVVKCYLK